MKGVPSTIVHLSLATFAFVALHAVHADVKCTGGEFVNGTTASVRCHFGEDINETRHNFNIAQYKSAQDTGTYVLLCNWVLGRFKPECTTKDGYSIDDSVALTDTLRLEITSIEHTMAGMYVCQLVPDNDIPTHTCFLNVTDVHHHFQHLEPNCTAKDSAEPIQQGGLLHRGSTTTQGNESRDALIIIAVILTLIIFILLSGLFLLWWKFDLVKRHRQLGHAETDNEDGWVSVPCCHNFTSIMKALNVRRPPGKCIRERTEVVPLMEQTQADKVSMQNAEPNSSDAVVVTEPCSGTVSDNSAKQPPQSPPRNGQFNSSTPSLSEHRNVKDVEGRNNTWGEYYQNEQRPDVLELRQLTAASSPLPPDYDL